MFPNTMRNPQEDLDVLEEMLREAEAEAEADALLYDSLERLARNATRPISAQTQGENGLGSRGGLFGNQNQSQRQRTTVEEVEDEDAGHVARPPALRNLDELFAADEAVDLEEADDEHEDTDEEEEEGEVEEDDGENEDEEGQDDYYRRSDRNARARALARAEAKKEAKEERKKKKEAREAARAARAARLRASANGTANASASGSRLSDGPRLFDSPASPLGGGQERNPEPRAPRAWSRYANQLRDLAAQMRDDRPTEGHIRRHPNPFPYYTPNRPSAAANSALPLGAAGVGATGGGTGTGTGLPGGAGSRTFLIYVIGGYYPPDHSIVTGGPESFESFEALLCVVLSCLSPVLVLLTFWACRELAEMLGHGKPPTVTKEEIAKSGLETIKSTQLAAYEEQGKIASNCTERVSLPDHPYHTLVLILCFPVLDLLG